MKLHYRSDGMANLRYRKVKAVANLAGVNVEDKAYEKDADISALSPMGILPLLETPEGNFCSAGTICRYFALTSNKLYCGENVWLKGQVDQWMDFSVCEFEPAIAALIVSQHPNKEGFSIKCDGAKEDIQKFMKVFEEKIAGKKFLVGDDLSIADVSLACSMGQVLPLMSEEQRNQYPQTTAWYLSMVAADANIGPKELPKEADKLFKDKKDKGEKKDKKDKKKEETKKEEPKKEEGDDLFDDDPTAAPAPPVEKPKPKPAKKKPIAKSIVTFDVKVYEQETDLEALAKKIREEIKLDGMVWNQDTKILPVAYGMNKVQMGCVVEDEKVSTEDIFEKIEEYEDVQSTDVVGFQKL